MPYFIDEHNCVRKGTESAPGEVVTCHDTNDEAVAHLRALYANVEDAKEVVPGLWTYKDGEQNRWVSIPTVEELDADAETFGTECWDYAIQYAKESGEYPELRVFHIRGAKAGVCDRLARYGKYAFAEGGYYETPFAKETRRVVDAGGLPRVSIGFSVDEATGDCPGCGARLRVGPRGLKIGFECPVCKETFTGKALEKRRFTKARVFDITATDRPAVRSTALANYTLMKEQETMSRDEIKTRLVERGFKEEVVSAWLESLSDDDLQRMKEDQAVEAFKEAVEKAKEDKPEPPPLVEMKDGSVTCFKCGSRMRIRADETKEVVMDIEPIVAAVKEAIPKEFEVELPELEGRLDKIDAALTALKDLLDELSKTEEERAKEIVNNASPAMITRLRLRHKEEPEPHHKEPAKTDGERIKTGQGLTAGSLTEAMGLKPLTEE